MSYFKTKQALITQLLTVIDPDDCAFEGKVFDPENKALWYHAHLIPVSSDILGKTEHSCNEQRGIFQVSVCIPRNNDDYDNTQMSAVDTITSAFSYNTNVVYNGQNVTTLNSNVGATRELESWLVRDITIDYLTFSER